MISQLLSKASVQVQPVTTLWLVNSYLVITLTGICMLVNMMPKIPVQHLNGIVYAFIGFDSDGSLHLLDPNSDNQQLPVIATRALQYPYLKTFLSFGGWTLSYKFHDMANDQLRVPIL